MDSLASDSRLPFVDKTLLINFNIDLQTKSIKLAKLTIFTVVIFLAFLKKVEIDISEYSK